jgi:anhydro-N-acetylmuramic acid kinase
VSELASRLSLIESFRSSAPRLVVGVMSGTSLDGVDVAFVEISSTGSTLKQHLRGFSCIPYPQELKQRLLRASAGDMSLRDTFELDADLGALYADAIVEAADHISFPLQEIDAIGLHGQTVYHAPHRQPNGVTVQLGSAAIVAGRLRAIVVDDFRSNDVAAGGEGAPLVPYCDYILLGSPHLNRVALNIGGIANITWLPKGGSPDDLVAFDTGPGNMLIDAAMRRLRNRDYDLEGAFASRGTPDQRWLAELLDHPYFTQSPPKSTGRELFGEEVGVRLVEEGARRDIGEHDIVATLTLLTARSIARGITRFASKGEPVDQVIVGGGGSGNLTMMEMLAGEMPGTTVMRSDELDIPTDAKEAICFAILANEALCETPANVPSVTGAARAVVCGSITLP